MYGCKKTQNTKLLNPYQNIKYDSENRIYRACHLLFLLFSENEHQNEETETFKLIAVSLFSQLHSFSYFFSNQLKPSPHQVDSLSFPFTKALAETKAFLSLSSLLPLKPNSNSLLTLLLFSLLFLLKKDQPL